MVTILHLPRRVIFLTVLLFKGQINWGSVQGQQTQLPHTSVAWCICAKPGGEERPVLLRGLPGHVVATSDLVS